MIRKNFVPEDENVQPTAAPEPVQPTEPVRQLSEEQKNAQLAWKRAQEDIYEDPEIILLAEKCSEGDTASMKQMAAFFRSRCTEPLIRLLDQYDREASVENETEICQYLHKNFYERNTAKAYMMWLVRAAYYGDQETAAFLLDRRYYRENALIPYPVMTDGKGVDLGDSDNLYKAGFRDMPRHYDECTLRYKSENRTFCLTYLSDYEPPDEDGFGAEWEYDSVYFDEFFRPIRK